MVWPTGARATGVIAVLLTLGPWTRPAECSRILAIETVAGRSHWNFMSSVLQALTDGGHRVTVFTPFPGGDRENYTEIDTSGELPKVQNMSLPELMDEFGGPVKIMWIGGRMARVHCDIVYGNGRMTEILEAAAETDFDAILVEPIWLDCMSHLAAELNRPVVYIIPQPMITFLERSFHGHMPNPSSVSHLLADHAVPRTFAQRFANTVLTVYSVLTLGFNGRRLKYFEPKPYDVSATVQPSLMFVNSHYISEAPRPTPANVIPIGGIHLKSAHTLPRDILEFIEDSPHGVIYFTFGSVIAMSTLPEPIQDAFREALSQVPQRVLWKYEGEMKDKPKNVMTSKWFPQRDVLMHPKVKLFISHGGISGVYEAVDAGVPVLGFPLFYDQPRNIENLVDAGMAISMDLFTINSDLFLKNVLELINDGKYMKNAKIASDRFKDRPMSPAESVVYWTEYVIRHKGAPHLKSHALNLTWYQYLLLDVISVLLILISLAILIIYKVTKTVYNYCSKYSQIIKAKSE